MGRRPGNQSDGNEEAQAAQAAGVPVRLVLKIGAPPQASPQENLKNLLKFGSQFDNIEIK